MTGIKLENVQTVPPTIHKSFEILLPKPAIELLFKEETTKKLHDAAAKIAIENKTTVEIVLEEFRRFLALKVFLCDVDGKKMEPSPMMTAIWHAAILNTRFYRELEVAIGMLLEHHTTVTHELTQDQTQARLQITSFLYQHFFDAEFYKVALSKESVEPAPPLVVTAEPIQEVEKRKSESIEEPAPKKQTTTVEYREQPFTIYFSFYGIYMNNGRHNHAMQVTSSTRITELAHYASTMCGFRDLILRKKGPGGRDLYPNETVGIHQFHHGDGVKVYPQL